ncbi:MAG: hypothetical protein JF603_12405, partial [Acidobacteria bacterium]|nr:hypothetical protein [Acidobacteriota bacterium]
MRRPRCTLGFVAFALASVALGPIALPVSRAGADPLRDKRAEAATLAAAIDADNERVDVLTARFEAAQLAASEVDARLAAEAAALATYRSRLAETGHAVRDIAVTEFMKGGQRSHPVIAVLDQNDPQGVVLARLLAGIAVSRTQDALDASKAAQQDLQAHMRTLRLEHR